MRVLATTLMVAALAANDAAAEPGHLEMLHTIVGHVTRRALEAHAREQERQLQGPDASAILNLLNEDLISGVFGAVLPCLNDIGIGAPIDCLFDTVVAPNLDEVLAAAGDALDDTDSGSGTGGITDDPIGAVGNFANAPNAELLEQALTNTSNLTLQSCQDLYTNSSAPFIGCMHLIDLAAIETAFQSIKADTTLSAYPACVALNSVTAPPPLNVAPLGTSIQLSTSQCDDDSSDDSSDNASDQIDNPDVVGNLTAVNLTLAEVFDGFKGVAAHCEALQPGITDTFRVEQKPFSQTGAASSLSPQAGAAAAFVAVVAMFF